MSLPAGHVIVFEDSYYSGFYPISLSRPIYHILAGARTNLERIKYHLANMKFSR